MVKLFISKVYAVYELTDRGPRADPWFQQSGIYSNPEGLLEHK